MTEIVKQTDENQTTVSTTKTRIATTTIAMNKKKQNKMYHNTNVNESALSPFYLDNVSYDIIWAFVFD